MRDIFADVSVKGCVTFTAETERGRAWMGRWYHETTRTYATDNPIERAEAERFRKQAAADQIDVYDLMSN